MDTLIIVILIAFVIGAIILKVVFWGFIIKLFVDHISKFNEDEQALYQLLNQYNAIQQTKRKVKGIGKAHSPSVTEMEIYSRLADMQSHLGQMNNLQRQKYETRMSGMMGSVINAGFTNFNPSDYY
jgi:predicted membrane protein